MNLRTIRWVWNTLFAYAVELGGGDPDRPRRRHAVVGLFAFLYILVAFAVWLLSVWLYFVVESVRGFVFGYEPQYVSSGGSHSARVDAEKGETVYEDTLHRYIIYRDRWGRSRTVRQSLPPVVTRRKIGQAHDCPTFDEAVVLTGAKPSEEEVKEYP